MTFEKFAAQILGWAFGRIEQDAARRGMPRNAAHKLICSMTISYLEKGGKSK